MLNKLEKKDVVEVFSLTPMQEAMLLHVLEEPGSRRDHEQLCLELPKPLDFRKIDNAWTTVAETNEMLRAVFRWEELEKPVQIILKKPKLNIRQIDLTGYPEAEAEKRRRQIVREDRDRAFDWAGPPFRVTLCKMPETQPDMMVVTHHHILYDGWSNAIILQEFLTAYKDRSTGSDTRKIPKTPFKEYVRWLQQRDTGKERQYWQRTLADYDPSPGISPDQRNATRTGTTEFADHKVELPDTLNRRLKEYAAREKVTVSAQLYAAWGRLLQEYNRSSDVLYDTTVSGRAIPLKGVEQTVGLFISTIPLRVKTEPGETRKAFISKINENLRQRQEFENSAPGNIRGINTKERQGLLFDSVVVIENYPQDLSLVEGQVVTETERTGYDLTLIIIENEKNHRLELHFAYNTALFNQNLTASVSCHYMEILEAQVAAPTEPLEKIKINAETEIRQLLMQQQRLREITGKYATEENQSPPRKGIEEKLAGIWAAVLEIEPQRIGRNTNFFENGGHSLKAGMLAAQLRQEFRVKMPLTDVFRYSTLEEQAKRISEIKENIGPGAAPETESVSVEEQAEEQTVEPAEEREYYELSPAQQRFYIMHTMAPGSTILNMPAVLSFEEDRQLNPEDREEIFRQLIRRHESLRTSVEVVEGNPVQRVHPADDIEFSVEEYNNENGETKRIVQDTFVRPFDLTRPPLFRVGIIDTGTGKRQMVFDIHHIVSDGASQRQLAREYLALREGRQLPPQTLQYRDYARWREKRFRSGAMKCHENYWTKHLDGAPQGVKWPPDNPNPKQRGETGKNNGPFAGDTVRVTIDTHLTRTINRQIRETGTTLYMVLQAALNILLAKYTGQTDIPVGSPVAGRGHVRLEPIVGLLMGAIVVRTFPAEEKKYSQYLREIKEITLEAYEHQEYPYEELIRKQAEGTRETIHTPFSLTNVGLNVQNQLDRESRLNRQLQLDSYTPDTAKLDLTLNAVERENDILLELEYAVARFRRETVERLAGYIVQILKEAADNPDTRLAEFQLITEAERRRITGGQASLIPLSHPQKRIYYTEKMYPGNTADSLAFTVRYRRQVKKQILEQAVNHVIRKNDALRLRLLELEHRQEPCQYIAEYEYYPLEEKDFSGEEQSRQRLLKWINADLKEPYPLLNTRHYRFVYLRYNSEESGYYLKLHHLVSDGWTIMQLLVGEIDETVQALESGRSIDGTPNPSYTRYIRDEQQYLAGPAAEADRQFWLRQMNPQPEPVILSLKNKKNIKNTIKNIDISGAREVLEFPPELREQMHRYRENEGQSFFKQVYAALALYIERVTGLEDLIIGSVGHNRAEPEHKRMMGMFVSTIPLRVRLEENLTFKQQMERIGRDINHTLKNHQRYPYDMLQEDIRRKTKREPGHLLNVNLIGHSGRDENRYRFERHFPGDEPTPLTIHINLCNRDKDGEMELEWDYRHAYYDTEDIRRIHRGLVNILTDALTDPDKKVREIECLSPEEKEMLLTRFNETAAAPTASNYPANKTYLQYFEEQTERTPHHIALTCDGISLTYRRLNGCIQRLAQQLRHLGLTPGSIAALKVRPSLEMAVGILGILKSGAAYLPVDPATLPQRLQYILNDSGANIIIIEKSEAPEKKDRNGEPLQETVPVVLELERMVLELDLEHVNLEHSGIETVSEYVSPDSLAYIIYTSGSTGRPKGVMVEHCNLMAYLNAFDAEFGLTARDVVIQNVSCAFDAFVEELYPILIKGGKLVIPPEGTAGDIPRLAAVIETCCVTMITASPLQLNELNRLEGYRGVKLCISGADELKPNHIDNLQKKGTVYNTYGPTEATVCASYYRLAGDVPANIPIGKPITGYRIEIRDRRGRLQPVGIPGELIIGGPGVARGYLNNPEQTAEKFHPHRSRSWNKYDKSDKSYMSYHTGDKAMWMPDGNIQFLGRIDHQVKIRGYRIELGEVEARLLQNPQIREAVVTAREDAAGEKMLCAYIVGAEELDLAAVRLELSKRVPAYMVPARWVQLDVLPLTAGGKVDRRAMPEPEMTAGEEYIAPRNERERRLVDIWADVLDIRKETISIRADFFALGGHSLRATYLATRIAKEMEIKIPLTEVFKRPTVEEQAAYVAAANRATYEGIEPVEEREYYPLSSAQKRLYFLQRMDPESTGYNMPLILTLEKRIDVEKLEITIQKLIARHESLRTSFIEVDGKPYQRIHPEVKFQIQRHAIITPKPIGQNKSFAGVQGAVFQKSPLAAGGITAAVRPFEMSQAPLMRSVLVERGDGGYTWMVDVHHIVSDGTSHSVLTEDFRSIYAGGEPEPLRIQYKEFARWQNRMMEDGALAGQERYWRRRLGEAGEQLRLEIPGDRKRPEVFTFEGAKLGFRLPEEQVPAFREQARRCGGTLYMNLLTALNTLFYRYTGQTDIIIGTGIAGRHHEDLQRIIGMFVNTLAMRNRPGGEKSYDEFLKEVVQGSLEAFENQDLQFEELVDRLGWERDTSRNPLFDVSMVVQNYRWTSEGIKTQFKPEKYDSGTSKFDMTFFVFETGDDVQIEIEYYTAVYVESTIRRLAGHLKNIVSGVLREPSVKIKDIEIMTDREKRWVLEEINETGSKYPQEKTIHEWFEEQAEETPWNVAVSAAGGEHLTYRELERQANRLANYLGEDLGVRPEDRVGILQRRGINLLITIMGILKSGAAYVPVEPKIPEERIKSIIDDAGIEVVITEKNYIKTMNRLQWSCRTLRTILLVDTDNVYAEEEEKNQLMDESLWEYVGRRAEDEIAGGGWVSSYTGEPFSKKEMDEYGDNILEKLTPHLDTAKHVLEIGCASGITMFRIAPGVGSYTGTDLSRVIIEKNRERVKRDGHRNIQLAAIPAHRIETLGEKRYDIIIINSVIQSFHGHNYLRNVLRQCIGMLSDNGILFIGDIMNQDSKAEMINHLNAFKEANPQYAAKTKTDWSSELFVSPDFFKDVQADFPEIADLQFSEKIHTVENELTLFRYDAAIRLDKTPGAKRNRTRRKQKYQHDRSVLEKYGFLRPHAAATSRNTAYVIYTSGTTGRPRGVMVEHRSLVNYARWGIRQYLEENPQEGRSFLSNRNQYCFPLYTSVSFDLTVTSIILPLLSGNRITVAESEDSGQALLEMMEQRPEEAEVIKATPSHLKLLREESEPGKQPGIHTRYIVGGEQLDAELAEEIYRKHAGNATIYNEYGPTEATVGCMIYRYRPGLSNGPVPIGVPIANAKIYLLDRHQNPAPPGAAAELYIAGDVLARGYLNSPLYTSEKFIRSQSSQYTKDLLYRTGDLARILSDGNIEFLGRADHQVKIRGHRIEISEIESQLKNIPGIKDAVVIARTGNHDSTEQSLYAYVVPATGISTDADCPELRESLAAVLPDYMIPSTFVTVRRIPLTPNGKVDTRTLLDTGNTGTDKFTPPQNETERKLVDIWSGVLGIEPDRIGTETNFFQLGGHSLKATILVSRIHRELKIKFPLADVFKYPTVKAMAEQMHCLRRLSEGPPAARGLKRVQQHAAPLDPLYRFAKGSNDAVIAVEEMEFYELSSAQKRLFILQEMAPDSTAYNISQRIPIAEDVEPGKIETVIKQLIARHESLRTSFIKVNDTPVQKVLPPEEIDFKMEECTEETGPRPFELSRAPLLRTGIYRRKDGRWYWMLEMHHIISDGTSSTILAEDFMDLYSGRQLEPLRFQYKDYSQWRNDRVQKGEFEKQEDFWLSQFADAPDIPRLQMPTDKKRPGVFTFEGAVHTFTVAGEDADIFRNRYKSEGITPYMKMLAHLNILFHKYTGQTDIIIGSGIAGRPHADLQRIVGMFVNTLPMRNKPQPGKSYKEFLDEVAAYCIEAFENQDYQFEELVDKLELERDASRNPLLDISMVVQNFGSLGDQRKKIQARITAPERQPDNDGKRENEEIKSTTSKFDMTFFVMDDDDGIQISIEYYTGIYKRDTIRRLTNHLRNIRKIVAQNPSIRLKDIEIITEEEKRLVLETFNAPVVEYPRNKTIHQLFEEQARRTPDHIALIGSMPPAARGSFEKPPLDPAKLLFKEVGTVGFLAYRELNSQANRVARYLIEDKNLQPEERVGLMMKQGVQRPVALLGILKAGGAYVPIDPQIPMERITFQVNDASIGIILSEKEYIRELNRLQWECPGLHTFMCMDSDNVDTEEENRKSQLMDQSLWRHVGETAADDIGGGGWISSYTGEPMTRAEMDEYGDNTLKKLEPLLHPRIRVLEIGCASGITMFRIAPNVGLYYGTDLSDVIIEKNRQKAETEGHDNIRLACLQAHEIKQIEERDFDLVIINSVIQCFHGYNYLRNVLRHAIDMMTEQGTLFIGDIMDLEQKEELIRDMEAFKKANHGSGYSTKTDFEAELFVSRAYWQELAAEFTEIADLHTSRKIHSIENELTRYRYDAIIKIDKVKRPRKKRQRQKHRDDRRVLAKFDGEAPSAATKTGAHSLAYIIYTSGTTGRPKGVMLEHRGIANLSEEYGKKYMVGSRDRVLQFANTSFDASVSEMIMALLAGAALCLPDREIIGDMGRFRQYLHRYDITAAILPPSYARHLDIDWLRNMRILVTAGAAADIDFVRKSRDRYRYVNGYGPTENSICSTHWFLEPGTSWDGNRVPIGKPVQNVRHYIVNRHLQLQPIGIAGELLLSGDGLARGYLNRPELTAARFVVDQMSKVNGLASTATDDRRPTINERYYHTGDLCRWLPDGNIEYIGRIDQQVKIRGYRIELGEIENCLVSHDSVKKAVVIDRTDGSGETYLCAYVVYRTEAEPPPEAHEIKEYLSRRIPEYMIPAYIAALDELPFNAAGKVNRKALPAPEATQNQEYTAPRNRLEKTLVTLWTEVLGLEGNQRAIGIDDGFFEMGGHSLKATLLTSKVHKELAVKLPLAEVFRHQTVRQQADYIRQIQQQKNTFQPEPHRETGERFISIEPVEEREYYPLSAAQKRLYIIYRMEENSTRYNMPYEIPLKEEIDIRQLEAIFQKLIRRHESLRTSFHMINEEPVQRIHQQVEFGIEKIGNIGDKGSLCSRRQAIDKSEKTYEPPPRCRDAIYRVHPTAETKINQYIRPFDLSKPPLVRVALKEDGIGGRRLLVDVHHIVSDGVSQGILEREFAKLEKGEALALQRLQYKDYAGWQNSEGQQAAMKKQEEYWLGQYGGELPVLEIPADNPRPKVQEFKGRQMRFTFGKLLTETIKELSKQTGATVYMIMMAALNILMAKLSGGEDIIIGTPIAGRRHADLQGIIGMFVNTLAIRNAPSGRKEIRDFLGEVKRRTLEAYENQEYPFEELVSRVMAKRDTSRNPIYDIVLNHLNQSEEQGRRKEENIDEKSETGTVIDEGETRVNFDMVFQAVEYGGIIEMTVNYDTALYKKETLQRYIRYYKQILQSIVEDPGETIAAIEMQSVEELRRLLVDYNDTSTEYPSQKTIPQILKDQVHRTPDAVAATIVPGVGPRYIASNPSASLTYKELDNRSGRLAYCLQEKGVVPDSIVAIRMERGIELIIAILGILKAGGAYLPIEMPYPEERIEYMLKDSAAEIVIRKSGAPDTKNETTPVEVLDFEQLDVDRLEFENESDNQLRVSEITASNLAYVLYTSGSTGQSKGVMVEHRGVVRLVKETAYMEFEAGQRLLQTGAVAFDASTFEIWGALLNGLELCIGEKEDMLSPEGLKGVIRRHRIGILWLTSALFNQLSGLDDGIFDGVKYLLVGGDVLSPVHIEAVRRRNPHMNIINGYGPTENTTFTTTHLIRREYTGGIPIGKPIANTTVYIADKYMKPVPIGVTGEIYTGGDGVARGYLNHPEMTDEMFINNELSHSSLFTPHSSRIYKTGDRGCWLPGGIIQFLGRADQQVKIRGYRIEPGEIENLLLKHEAVAAAVVVPGRKAETSDMRLTAYYVVENSAAVEPEPEQIRLYIAAKLPAHMMPHHIIKIDRIPLTPNGKVDRDALPEPGYEPGGLGAEYEAPTNEIERILAEIWRDVLQISIPGINDNFFEIGGDSIKAIQVAARLRQQGLELKIGDLFLNPTIKDAAPHLIELPRETVEEEDSYVPVTDPIDIEDLDAFEDEFSDLD
jgi:amino acid adenylation domain-containing protein